MFGERLPETQRWPDILQKLSGWEMINRGRNGRLIPQDAWSLESFDRELAECGPVDLVLIMLGTNDLLEARRYPGGPSAACRKAVEGDTAVSEWFY